MGLTGSLHCVGMCGPIIWIMPFQRFTGLRKALALGIYHLSRISVYAAMAVVLHSFRSVFNPQVQQYVSIALGAVLLLAGLLYFFPVGKLVPVSLPWAGFVKNRLSALVGSTRLSAIALSGLLNGMLPCGLVYMALSATISLSTATDAILFVYTFGAGTVPVLTGISLLRSRMPVLQRSSFRKFTPVIVMCFGCLFLLRGLNLGIPYLSPKVQMQHGKVEHSCCHKK